MKTRIAAALILCLSFGHAASAGGLNAAVADPILKKELIIEQTKATSSSSGTVLVALTAILMLAVTAAQ